MGIDERSTRPQRLDVLRQRAAKCRRCDLYKHGTQTVFGEGRIGARVMVVGEQPGDREDIEGEPFVGPAGRLLRDVLHEAGFDESEIYFTNAVKHFKWEPRGKRRIDESPNRGEVRACRKWLDGEIAEVRPTAIVALGATVASALVGPSVRVARRRAKPIASTLAPLVTVTVHPASILRTRDSASRAAARRRFVEDWRAIARLIPPERSGRRSS